MGDGLDPDSITELTRLTPANGYRKGDLRRLPDGSDGAPYRCGLWSVSTEGAVARGASLDEHLSWLLDRLEPFGAGLRAVIDSGARADFFCGYFMGEWNSGWTLRAATLERVAGFGVDIYGPHEPDAVRRISHRDTILDRLVDVVVDEIAWLGAVDRVESIVHDSRAGRS
jgi:hypothetical protein